jgi:endonuclease III
MKLKYFLHQYGRLYSDELGIDLERDPFEWLIASILYGNRISTKIARNTFLVYRDAGLTTPESIDQASRGKLIEVHGKGGYTRYDGITATYMKDTAAKVIQDLDGKLAKLDEISDGPQDLEDRLLDFKGVGTVTARIFLREMRGIWKNADPEFTDIETNAALKLGIVTKRDGAKDEAMKMWRRNVVEGYSFRNLQAALVRIGLEIRRGREVEPLETG